MARKRAAKQPDPPGPQLSDADRAELDDRLAKMLTKPNRTELIPGRIFLLWSARDDSGSAQVMVWNPETDDEIRNANYFYDAAHGLGEFAKPVQTGKPVRRTAEHKAFIAGILANRDDDTGYLVYADYLTEHGDPKGDFIRLSVELAQLPPESEEAREKNDRVNDLMSAHSEEWFAPLGELGLRPEFYGTFMPWAWTSYRHGVIEEVVIDRSGVLPENATRLFAATPFLRKIQFEQGHLDPAGLAKVKQLTQIEELELYRTDLDAEKLRTLLRSKYLTGLKSLNIGGNDVGHAGVRELAAWPGLARLETLELFACNVGPEAVAELVRSPGVANLKCLRVGSNGLDSDAVGAILASPRLGRLTELDLNSAAGLEPDTMRRFQSAAFAKTLEILSLDSAFFAGGFEAFTKCKLPALRVLKLNNVALSTPEACQLASAAFAGNLEELYLDNCSLNAGSANFFYQAKFPKLKTLDVSRNRIERFGVERLAGSAKNFPALTNLRLWDNRLNGQAIALLAKSKVLTNLTHLDLNGNKITSAGAAALAESKYLTKLTNLVVDEKEVGKKGKQALIDRFGEGMVSFR